MALPGCRRAGPADPVLDPASGELTTKRLNTDPLGVLGFLEELGPMRAVYESGPTGFTLARAARKRGLEVQVAAAGFIPRGPADRIKTDRRDAQRLARLLAAGELRFVWVPTPEQERFRDLVRAIEDARGDLMRARHRLQKFLDRRGWRFPGPGGNWTRAHHAWLGSLGFDDRASQATLIDYLAAVTQIAQRREAMTGALEELWPQSPHAETVARLRCFRGIDTLSACGLCAEVSDFRRFERPTRLSAFLGIVPSERTSDEKRRQGAITKAGSKHARRLLVEAAKHYRHQPRIGEKLRRRQQGQDPRACEVAWRAQRRLNARWQSLEGARGKASGVVTIAVARELAAFCWEAAVLD